MFRPLIASSLREIESRASMGSQRLKIGVEYLDDALRGILPDDLILLGAPSGMGKTQLCCNIALANIAEGKRVHYFALEAGEYEIERRLKYPMVADLFYSDPNRPRLETKLNYTDWLMGRFMAELQEYELRAADEFEKRFKNFFVFYKGDRFGVSQLVEAVTYCADDTDLIMIDHVHYFDFDDDNENRAMKDIAKTVRTLALEQQKPIILVAHLRKRDRHNDELVAGLDEFHGSSDLYKIATRVITMSPGKQTGSGEYETFFRIPKNRLDGGVTRFIGKEIYSARRGGYEKGRYQIGWSDQTRKTGFAEVNPGLRPTWARGQGSLVSDSSPFPKGVDLSRSRRGPGFD